MFLSLTNVKKSFGQGDSRVEVLKALISRLKKENSVFSLDLPDLENPLC